MVCVILLIDFWIGEKPDILYYYGSFSVIWKMCSRKRKRRNNHFLN